MTRTRYGLTALTAYAAAIVAANALTALTAYAAAIVAANALTAHNGLVPVGFGLTATAGTYAAGAALMLRNLVQDALGRRFVLAAIAAGAALSALTSPALALASGCAFAVAELADTALYTPLRRHGWARAVLPASLLGAILDSLLFLSIAGFPVTLRGLAGQIVGKAWAVWLPVLAVALARGVRRRDPLHGHAVESSGA